MATKLKKPITITFTHVENAVLGAILNGGVPSWGTPYGEIHPNLVEIRGGAINGEFGEQIEDALKAQGIDWRTWLPPQPFKIAGRECEFNPDGTVKISCGTVISNAEIEEFKKRREEAQIYLYWEAYTRTVYRAKTPDQTGEFFYSGRWQPAAGKSMTEWQSDNGCKPITRAEALATVGAENIDK